MRHTQKITSIVFAIVICAIIPTSFGIFSKAGPGQYSYKSIRGETIEIYGQGLYQHMSADVAIQGIAQDYVTLFIGIPLLLLSLISFRRGSMKGQFVLSGTLGYFFVTYLFYTAMGMYNIMFLGYVILLGLSFFGLTLTLFSFDPQNIGNRFSEKAPAKFVGGFLMFNAVAIALQWLSVVLPPLFDGSIYPEALHHYTTLIVQGFDLGLLLPISVVVGWMLYRKQSYGYVFGTTYIIFLAILMTALTAKIIAMGLNGVNVIPVIFIIPTFNLIAIISAYLMVSRVQGENSNPRIT